jgi:DNA-binding winged helix-turn-helix (wHTH) protein/tetratricopeptide (TPR) repeat protein
MRRGPRAEIAAENLVAESVNPEFAGTVYRFESFELDPGLYVLRRDGVSLDVQPKVLDLLLYLVARRDRVVTKEEILDALWPGVTATDDVLSRAIHAARQAVGDDGDQQSIIQTVRRRGFRFVAPVAASDALQAAPPHPIAAPRPSRQAPAFVGRQRELQRLDESLEEANRSCGRIVFVSGEAGGGKTRLLEEFVRRAASTATVYSGWCWEGEGARSYWPWVQILRALIGARSPEKLRDQMGFLAPDIARIVPSLREKLPELPDSPAVQSDKERFRLFDSITCFLRRVASDDGTQILVLDDLQWADAPSMRLIDFLAHEMVDAPILVLGAYREETIGQPLIETLGVLSRRSLFEQVTLKGLTSTEIAQLLRVDGDGEPSEELVTAVADKTDGNPFLVAELAQLIKSQPSAFRSGVRGAGSFSLPQGVTAVVQRRLAMLPPEAHRVLAVAAVIGQEFSREILVQSLDANLRLGPLDEALRSNIVSEVPHALGRYRFTHALVSEALYEEIEISERARIHRRVAGVLERIQGMSPTSNLADIAFHYTHGVSSDDFEKAIVFARRTGERAAEQLAWEEASTHFRDALKLLEQREARTANERCHLLLATAEAERRAGNLGRAREAFALAADLARRFELPEILGRAALGVQTPWDILSGSVDEVEVSLLEDALRFHTDPQSLTRARLLGRLAIATYWNNDSQRGLALTEEAIAIARNSGDPSALAEAMIAQLHVITRPFFIDRQVPLVNEIVRLAYESGDPNLIFTTLFYRSEDLLVCGDAQGIDRDFAEISRLADQLRQPPERSFVKILRATRLLYEGHVAESAAVGREALDLGTLGVDLDYQLTRTLLRFGVCYERLQLEALEDEVRTLAETHPAGSMWFCALANLCSQIGKDAEARNLFDSLSIRQFSTVSPDYGWEVSLHHLAEVCVRLQERESAAVLYRQLLPHDGRFVALSWIAFCGPISRYLALLAPIAGRERETVGHFEAAIQSCQQLGANLWTARVRCDYARFLLQREQRGDREKALELRESAMREAQDLDSPRLKAEIDSITPS